jgi:hypothetical protein
MNKNQVIAVIAAILMDRDKSKAMKPAVEEARKLVEYAETGEEPKSNFDGNLKLLDS